MSSHTRRRHCRIMGYPLIFVMTIVTLVSTVAAAADEKPGRAVPLLGNEHIQSPGSPHTPYNSDPPTSGPHVGRWVAPWGVHKVPIPLEVQVHNLEDGGVVIQYNCSPCPDLVAKLEALTTRPELLAMPRALAGRSEPPVIRLVVAPYPTMKSKIALTAWGRIETLDTYDEAKILRFINAYIGIDHHPATPER